HIGGCGAHNGSHHWPERFFAPYSEYRHGQLAFGNKSFVIGSVLIERLDLLEPGVHRARLGIELRVMRAGSFIEFCRISGKFVPETIEVYALASLYEPLSIRTPE